MRVDPASPIDCPCCECGFCVITGDEPLGLVLCACCGHTFPVTDAVWQQVWDHDEAWFADQEAQQAAADEVTRTSSQLEAWETFAKEHQ